MKKTGYTRFALALLGFMTLAAPVSAEIDMTSREGVIAVNRKIQCSMIDNVETTYVWHGQGFSRRTGERDKLLFKLLGMNVRQCVTVKNDKGEEGYRLVSREIMLYLDPKSGELMDSWENPWTGETLDVIHVANDPVNQRPSFGYGRDGKVAKLPIRKVGDYWQMNAEIPLFYHNVLGGDYQKYVGGTYHATEIFDFYGMYDELVSDDNTHVNPGVAWVRISSWLPWMEMNGREGGLYFNAQGAKLESWNDLPKLMKDQIAKNYPEYTNAPAGDDKRPNETSWTYFKKIFDERNEGKSAPKGGH
ncbi:DUF1838 domain-containing protein [Halioglobus maricola]|uniref:DUF1838 domain-containing protein n=2 Tax=Halioglobus maricola TaxID=2601894 RepID=A0A5P9NRU8_9GAMM|nr:DUF1838 domain-containing protein [Halioglobus maricola]